MQIISPQFGLIHINSAFNTAIIMWNAHTLCNETNIKIL